MKINDKSSGILLASAAAILFMNGPVMAAGQGAAQEAKIHCGGINACKGQSECMTATNSCKGQNACKGQGFISTTKKECMDKGGKVLKGGGMM